MSDIIQNLSPSWYSFTMLTAILISAYYWFHNAKYDPKLTVIYISALICAFIGAKLAYLFSEGWMHTGEDKWLHWLAGKSITGALLAGFIGVEIFKKIWKYNKITGDRFALIVPISIILGRIGCLTQGCCAGKKIQIHSITFQWPSVPFEIIFNALCIALFFWFRKKNIQTFQHFHIYLIAYGMFRFCHEFLRATPKLFIGLSGYQIISLCILVVGISNFEKRKNTTLKT